MISSKYKRQGLWWGSGDLFWVQLLACCFFCLCTRPAVAQLVVTAQKDAVFLIVSGRKGDHIQLENTDLSLIYGLELDIRQDATSYSLTGQDIEFQFPAAVTVFEEGAGRAQHSKTTTCGFIPA